MSYFPIFIDMTDRQVLVVGAGSVASRRVGVEKIWRSDHGDCTEHSPEEIRKLADSRKIRLIEQTYEEVRDTIWQEKNFLWRWQRPGRRGRTHGSRRMRRAIPSGLIWLPIKVSQSFISRRSPRAETDSRIDFWRSGSGLTHRVAKEVRRVLAEAEVEDT